MGIAQNIADIRARMEAAAARSGRSAEDIRLIAVTKLHEPCEIDEAAAAGITDIAENKVQEIQKKYGRISSPVNWHLIGHLQTNKVKYIADKVAMIQSVDSLRLAAEIDRRAFACGRVMDVLIQVNAAREEGKFGIDPRDAAGLLGEITAGFPNVRVKGLMHIAPYAEDPEAVRPYFRVMKELYDELSGACGASRFEFLSMGMSHDFETAIEEGANMIRVGTSIFGARDYTKKMGGM